MYKGDLIGVLDACELLEVSRPTLYNYRKKYSISDFKIKREVKFSKTEVLTKLYAVLKPIRSKIQFSMVSGAGTLINDLKVDDTTYDLRLIDLPDGHGAISLICHFLNEIEKGKFIHLIVDESNVFLKAMNFFGILSKELNSKIFWDEETLNNIPDINYESLIKLPIRRLGVVGSHQSIVDDLTVSLQRQGYSTEVCSYIGWAMGELADNAATHAKKYPAFVYFEQYGEDKRYLQFTIGDVGIGIPTSLKNNQKYSHFSDRVALLNSFKPHVSGRRDEEERGKGLTDVLKIAMECSSYLRADSNSIGFKYYFNQGIDNFSEIEPIYIGTGTIISILFIDGNFGSIDREDVRDYIDSCLGSIYE